MPSLPKAMREVLASSKVAEDVLHVGQRAIIPASAGNRSGPFSAIQRLGVGQIDKMIFRESRMQRYIHISVNRSRAA